MEEIDPTPRHPLDPRSAKSGPLGGLDPTPKRLPGPGTAESGPLGGLDPTPKRLPGPPVEKPAEVDNHTSMSEHLHGSRMAGPERRNSPRPISPMPALEELIPPPATIQEMVTSPIPRAVEPQSDLERHETHTQEEPGKRMRKLADKQRKAAPQTYLKKKQRSQRLLKTLVILGLLLLIGGGCMGSLYFFETSILGPLGHFFHPLNGDNYSVIDGRTWNLLLLGSDNDNKFVYPDLLTQVIMVIHIDPLNNSVSMVSIPRDSWVHVPGETDMHKIDQAFYLGSAPHHSFDDGVRMARTTIEQDYGISIDRYAWIGLGGFASVINTLGGIDIDLTHPLLDDNYPDDTGTGSSSRNPYASKRLYLVPGPQHLSGEQALEYVRSRHADLVGDIGRTQRQQEILEALKQKLNLPTVFSHLSALFNDLTGKIYTDLSQDELLSFANFSRALAPEAIQRLTLGPGHGSQNYGTLSQVKNPGLGETQDVVLPNCENIQPEINAIFSLGDAQSCQVR